MGFALTEAGVLTEEERDQIRGGLDAVAEKIATGAKPEESDEDVHTMIDRMLHAEIGDPASRLHTGRISQRSGRDGHSSVDDGCGHTRGYARFASSSA